MKTLALALALACPSNDNLSQKWVEHTGPIPRAVYDAHLPAALDGASPALLTVNGESWWIGASRRGRGEGCSIDGAAAFYVNGREDAPTRDIVKAIGDGGEAGLRPVLIELRWYDAKDGRKHRWFDAALAKKLGWDRDGRGAPTESPRPIALPDAINELY